MCLSVELVAGARSSPLSRAQVEEIRMLLLKHRPELVFSVQWFETQGDLDQVTPLTQMDKTDFFTREIDLAVLEGKCRFGIHSAKDLPEPLHDQLEIVACTKGVDPSDVLVFRPGMDWEALPFQAKIGTSSLRREKNILSLRSDLRCLEIRGSIEKRLAQLDAGKFDAVIMAKAALIRLQLEREEMLLPGEVSPMQGRLALVARKDDLEIKKLFACLDGA